MPFHFPFSSLRDLITEALAPLWVPTVFVFFVIFLQIFFFFGKIFPFFVLFWFFLFCFYFYFFIIFMIRMKSSPLVSGFSLTSLMSLLITLSVDYFCRFQPCNGIMWFRGSDCKPLLTPLSKSQWNVVKCQNSELTDIFCGVCEFWQFYFWVFNLIT